MQKEQDIKAFQTMLAQMLQDVKRYFTYLDQDPELGLPDPEVKALHQALQPWSLFIHARGIAGAMIGHPEISLNKKNQFFKEHQGYRIVLLVDALIQIRALDKKRVEASSCLHPHPANLKLSKRVTNEKKALQELIISYERACTQPCGSTGMLERLRAGIADLEKSMRTTEQEIHTYLTDLDARRLPQRARQTLKPSFFQKALRCLGISGPRIVDERLKQAASQPTTPKR